MANNLIKNKALSAGFSMLELVVSLGVIIILATIAYQHMEKMAEQVERAGFYATQKQIQTQLTLKVADLYIKGQSISRQELAKISPIELMKTQPDNYAGKINYTEINQKSAGHWYYIQDRNWLVYKAKRVEKLENTFELNWLLVFRLKVKFKHPDMQTGQAMALTLTPIYNFKW